METEGDRKGDVAGVVDRERWTSVTEGNRHAVRLGAACCAWARGSCAGGRVQGETILLGLGFGRRLLSRVGLFAPLG